MLRFLTFAAVAALVTAGGRAATAAGQGTAARSAWAGVYSAEQATAGEKVYFEKCASCHGDDLAGRERAPALAGPQFLDGWHGKDLRRLLTRIEEMPPGAPVTAPESVNLLAYLLYASEMPAGSTSLPADRARLAEITFERTKP